MNGYGINSKTIGHFFVAVDRRCFEVGHYQIEIVRITVILMVGEPNENVVF
jgi:hypothetical protein